MRPFLLAFFLVASSIFAHAEVVRPAPDFTFPGIGKSQSLKGVRGQPVVLLIARSPKTGDFKEEVKILKEIYQQFANKQVLFVAAFTAETGPVKSDIPFLIANNGPAVASAFSVPEKNKFHIAIIGKDGNIDYEGSKVLRAVRVRDVIQNSYVMQATTGRM